MVIFMEKIGFVIDNKKIISDFLILLAKPTYSQAKKVK